jgi:ABC-type nickel/cobalt efflux system permease component RcnA
MRRTALVTGACGLGHVTVSVLLGLISLLFGLGVMTALGQRMESVAGVLVIAFGLVYGLWGVHRAVRERIHERMHHVLPEHTHGAHAHVHHHHHHHAHDPARRRTAWTLFLLFSADPCVAVIPLMFAAAPLGWTGTLLVVLAYEAATIATMVGLALPARAAAAATIRGAWVDTYGDALAGGLIAAVGVVVTIAGI